MNLHLVHFDSARAHPDGYLSGTTEVGKGNVHELVLTGSCVGVRKGNVPMRFYVLAPKEWYEPAAIDPAAIDPAAIDPAAIDPSSGSEPATTAGDPATKVVVDGRDLEVVNLGDAQVVHYKGDAPTMEQAEQAIEMAKSEKFEKKMPAAQKTKRR